MLEVMFKAQSYKKIYKKNKEEKEFFLKISFISSLKHIEHTAIFINKAVSGCSQPESLSESKSLALFSKIL